MQTSLEFPRDRHLVDLGKSRDAGKKKDGGRTMQRGLAQETRWDFAGDRGYVSQAPFKWQVNF